MKSIEKFYNVRFGIYSGVLLREKMAKKVSRLLYKQNQELKELLASDLSQVEVSNWTLAYPEGKQTSVKFYSKQSDDDKINRINVIDKTIELDCMKDVFVAEDSESAKKSFMEYHKNTKRG